MPGLSDSIAVRLMILSFFFRSYSGTPAARLQQAEKGEKRKRGTPPRTPAMGLRPPAPPAELFQVLCHFEKANTMRRAEKGEE